MNGYESSGRPASALLPPPPGRAPGAGQPVIAGERLVVGMAYPSTPNPWPIHSVEARMWWTPILGPSAYLAAARIADITDVGELLDIDLRSFGAALGLNATDRHGRSTIGNALGRLVRFGVATQTARALLVHTAWPDPSPDARRRVQDASSRCRLITLDNTTPSVIE